MQNDFDELVNHISPTLHRITHKLNGRFTFFNEDDLYQEAMIHLWLSYNKGILSNKTDSYILQGCYFHLKNHIRTVIDKASVVSLHEMMDNGDLSPENLIAAETIHPGNEPDAKATQERIEMALNEREMAVLNMSCDGLTVREIGQKLNVSHVMIVKIRSGLKRKISYFKEEIGYQN